MPRPLRKTAVTSLKMTPEVRDLWEQCAQAEDRSLTNLFEVLVRAHAKKLNILSSTLSPAVARAPKAGKKTEAIRK
jgi:hypothetical protein